MRGLERGIRLNPAGKESFPRVDFSRKCPYDPKTGTSEGIARFPLVRFIIAHAGVQHFEQAIALARDHSNVWLDTSSYFVTPGKLRRLVRELGARKLIFGSDYPVMALDPGDALQKILSLSLPAQEQEAILGGNLREILETAGKIGA